MAGAEALNLLTEEAAAKFGLLGFEDRAQLPAEPSEAVE